MKKYKFKNSEKKANTDLWLFTLASLMMISLLVFFGLWSARWDINVLLPGYGVWTKETFLETDIWIHARYIDGVKVTADTPRAVFDIGILLTSTIVQIVAFLIYMNERTRRLLKKATDVSYLIILKIISKFKSLQADMEFRKLIQDLDLKEKKDTWKLLAGIELEKHLQKEPRKVTFERIQEEKNWSKRTIRYIRKENKLRERITDKWIDDHIKNINFRYPKITTSMILTGNTSVKIARMAIEDVKAIRAKENIRRIISSLLTLVFVAVVGSIVGITFRYDVWKAVKDVLMYGIAIVFAFLWAVKSSDTIHKSKELELEDRLGYVQKYVGNDKIKQTKEELIDDRIKKSELENIKLQHELDSIKKTLQEIDQ